MQITHSQRLYQMRGRFVRSPDKYDTSASYMRRKTMKRETVVVLDFGGQYNQLIARRVRECNVYCEIYSYKTDIKKIKEIQPKGIIFTGGPNSCYEEDSPTYTKEIFKLGIPVLGICYGSQLMMHLLGGKVEKAP